MPLILVTNDDGVHSPGIKALRAALSALGDVRVVAPDREMSACAQSLTLTRPVEAEELETGVFAVNGTPTDCVSLAIGRLLGRRPDLVVSGINCGPNLGEDVFYSGTVAGAREAVFFGIPALAVSLTTRSQGDFAPAAAVAAQVAKLALQQGLPERTLLNINVPPGRPERVAVTVQGHREPEGLLLELFETFGAERDGVAQRSLGRNTERLTDFEAVRCGFVSITPLQTDTTHHAVLPTFVPWERSLDCRSSK
jgi:5'-nucleotidase